MKRILALALSVTVCLCASAQEAVTWTRAKMDASRTGCTFPSADNVPEALGTMKGKKYVAPNGKTFRRGSTPAVAALMIEAQPKMASVKEVIGHSENGMPRGRGQYALSSWFIDELMAATSELTGKKVDLGITNFGGIRADMPKGDVTVDDILSIFPFRNSLCYVSVKGADLRAVFERMAERSMQVVGGVKVVVEDHVLKSCLIGGEPLDDEKIYGLATISFLLSGGDGLDLSKGAIEIIDTEKYIYDVMLPYVRTLTASGKTVDYEADDRVVYINTSNNRRYPR